MYVFGGVGWHRFVSIEYGKLINHIDSKFSKICLGFVEGTFVHLLIEVKYIYEKARLSWMKSMATKIVYSMLPTRISWVLWRHYTIWI